MNYAREMPPEKHAIVAMRQTFSGRGCQQKHVTIIVCGVCDVNMRLLKN